MRKPEGAFVRDAVTRAWQREAERAARRTPTLPTHADVPTSRAAALLAALGREDDDVVPPRTRVVLPSRPAATTHAPDTETLLGRAMRTLAAEAPATFAARSEELSYLAIVIGAGCAIEGRRLRPVEAVQAAIATVSLGLDLAHGRTPAAEEATTLADRPADELFRLAFHPLHQRVVVRAKGRLAERAGALEPDVHDALEALAEDVPRFGGRRIAPRAELVAAEAWLASLEVGAARAKTGPKRARKS